MSDPVLDAENLAEILPALAVAICRKRHGKDCNQCKKPTPEALADWLEQSPPIEAQAEAAELLAAMKLSGPDSPPGTREISPKAWRWEAWPDKTARERLDRIIAEAPDPEAAREALRPDTYRERGGWLAMVVRGEDADGKPAALAYDLNLLHGHWCKLLESERPRHPLAPLVRAWQERPKESEVYRPKKRASLPRFHKTHQDDAKTLPALYGLNAVTEGGQLALPGIIEMPACTSWLLSLFDRAGGVSLAQGRGAPWALRLFVGALLHLPIANRDSTWRQLDPLPTEEVIRWLHPDGWDRGNKRRDWSKFPEALDTVDRLGVYLPGIGQLRPVRVNVKPLAPSDAVVQFSVMVPKAAARGARIDWPTLCKYGQQSAGLYRAYLTACSIMGESAYHGHPITKTIAAPVLDKDGRSLKRKGGGIIRSDTERTDNPNVQYVKAYTEAELTTMIGFDATDRRRRSDGMKSWTALANDGVIKLAQDGKKWRILGPDPAIEVGV